jgi:hypothetical protein
MGFAYGVTNMKGPMNSKNQPNGQKYDKNPCNPIKGICGFQNLHMTYN